MANQITPAPGWQIDPNNPQGVIPIVPGSTPPAANPNGTAGNLIKDPTTGAFTLAPGADQSPVQGDQSLGSLGLPSGAESPQPNAMGTGVQFQVTSTGNANLDKILGVPPGSPPPPAGTDAYESFNNQTAGLLAQIQAYSTKGNQNLMGAKDALTNTSVSGAGPTPFNPAIGANSQVLGQQQMQQAFQPAVTSVTDQMNATNTALTGVQNTIEDEQKYNQPQPLSPGDSLVTPGGQVLLNGQQYNVQIDPISGKLVGTPTNSLTSATPTDPIDAVFGSSNPMGAYATDPNYVSEIGSLYSTIKSLGVAQDPTTLQDYIDSNAKGAPVTGQMILTAAAAANIDPTLLATVLQHESDFGTQGAATTTNNPGNVGNTGSTTTSYKSWLQGVTATATNIASRMKASGSSSSSSATAAAPTNSPGTTGTSNVGGTFNSVYQAKVAQLPSQMQSYVDAGPFGVGYINEDRVPTTLQNSVQIMASQAGIPYLATADVASLQSLTSAQQNMNDMATAASKTLGNGWTGALADVGATYLNKATFGNAFPNFSQFQAYATAAVGALKGLAGSGGGFRITQTEIDTAEANMPESTDTLQHAQQKMQVLQGLIDTTVAKIFPDAPVPIIDKNGVSATIAAKNYSAAIALGAQPQLGGGVTQ